ncbi:MAG: tape measure protein [Prevotella sp.]|nr:tape measure protein [Prevotella sp.]
MDSILKYTIDLQQRGGGDVINAARQVDTQLQTVQRRAGSVGTALRSAFSFSSFKGSLMSIPGMSFLMNPYTLIGAGVGAIAKVGAQAEMTSTAFRTLVGDEAKAAEMLQQINDYSAKTPYTALDLTDNAKMMLNFGVQADKVNGYMRQLGDIAGGDANKLSSLSLVFGQVASAGRMTGQDLMQFINAGFNPLKELEKMTGKTYKELQDMMSKGQIGMDAVAAAIKHATDEGGAFHGMSESLSQTLSGRLSTLVGVIQQRAAEIYKVMQPAIMSVVDVVSDIVPPILTAIQKVIGVVLAVTRFIWKWREELGYLAAVVGVAAVALNTGRIAMLAYAAVTKTVTVVTKAWTVAQWLINAALTANPIGLVVAAVAALVAAVIYCWNNFEGFRNFLTTMWDTVKQFGNILKEYVTDRITELLNGLGKVGEALKALFSGEFSDATRLASEGFADISGVGSAKRLYDNAKAAGGTAAYIQNYRNQLLAQKQTETKKKTEKKNTGISKPGQKGSKTATDLFLSGGNGGGNGKGRTGAGSRKTAETLATGGTRNTTIHMSIGKFFDNIYVSMADKTDTAELEHTVLRCMNRALAIAASSDNA